MRIRDEAADLLFDAGRQFEPVLRSGQREDLEQLVVVVVVERQGLSEKATPSRDSRPGIDR
jgi:hypothetical protein